jgi:hypothetical protein
MSSSKVADIAWRSTVNARIWRGAVRRDDGDAYADYMLSTGIPGRVHDFVEHQS